MTPVALRIVLDISYVAPINHEIHFSQQLLRALYWMFHVSFAVPSGTVSYFVVQSTTL